MGGVAMSTPPVAGATSAEALAPPWGGVVERVRAYLETAGLKSSAAVELAREIVTGCAEQESAPEEEHAILSALRIARHLLTDHHDRSADQTGRAPLSPRAQPLSIKRRSFRS